MSVKEAKMLCRITNELKVWIVAESQRRGESEAVIVREALNEYRARMERTTAALQETPPAANSASAVDAAFQKGVQYVLSQKPRKPRKPV